MKSTGTTMQASGQTYGKDSETSSGVSQWFQLTLQHFACRTDWQGVPELHEPGIFVRGKLLTRPFNEHFLGDVRARLAHNVGFHLFTDARIRNTDDSRQRHGGMR